MTEDPHRPAPQARQQGDARPPPAPRWVKQLLLGLLAVVVLAVLIMLIVGGEHGPGRHGSLGLDELINPSWVMENRA